MKLFLLATLLTISGCLFSQVRPADGARLNYTQVLFEYPDHAGAAYQLEIWEEGDHAKPAVRVVNITSSQNAVIIGALNFGRQYKWRYTALAGKKILLRSAWYHFQTLGNSWLDTSLYRLQIRTAFAEKNDNSIVLLDGMKMAVNRQGKPVWLMNDGDNAATYRDINLTNDGFITFITSNDRAVETNLEGQTIWEAPDHELNDYHHDFHKLGNGHFMVCGLQEMQQAASPDVSGPTLASRQSSFTIHSASVIEFDAQKNKLWQFDLIPELRRSFGIAPASKGMMKRIGHLNGIAVDETNHIVYASFKNFSSVFKIDQRNNNILHVFGRTAFNLSDSQQVSPFFAAQHCPIILSNGNLIVLDNNVAGAASGIVEMKNSKGAFDDEKVWEYRFGDKSEQHAYASHMGSVQELPNGHFMVCAGLNNSRIFEVTRNKELVWEILSEKSDYNDAGIKVWKPHSNFKAFYASSLYPYYFTLRTAYPGNALAAAQLRKGLFIRVDNAGSEADTFTIRIEDPNERGFPIKAGIAANQSQTANISLLQLREMHKGEKIRISVASQKSGVVKTLEYKIQ